VVLARLLSDPKAATPMAPAGEGLRSVHRPTLLPCRLAARRPRRYLALPLGSEI